ncbi:MAG: hypothetical protein QOK44_1872, partial [Betaproteobacteria bacterium]|nr:hypothetical protein [Betaproteobacteria bacterium]
SSEVAIGRSMKGRETLMTGGR